ncbi:response regulator transcription factor [Bradyrhizobium sp. SRL28]|uniref:response regulator transcription factor n=1 Tax=Bradyrhizobium sp. SRL28 TaxID=2836178 RepID=UPI00201BE59B|nr:response regulator [Bradyrhizobium sp. SRL28]
MKLPPGFVLELMCPLKITFWQRNDIGLIFTDIDMPGSMDGLKLSHFVRGRWPPIKIIATSGHAKITENDLPEGVPLYAQTV